jgi:hypothetical protein
VLANGSRITANKHSHPDILRAIKGAGNNLGIVTSFNLTAFSQGALSVSSLTHSVTQFQGVATAFSAFADAKVYDPYASLVTGLLYSAETGTWTVTSTAIYTKDIAKPPVWDGLRNVSTADKEEIIRLGILSNETATPPL